MEPGYEADASHRRRFALSLQDRSSSTSKNSPSSLLPPDPHRSPSNRTRSEHLPQQRPSSLLPEAPRVKRDQDLDDAVAVSPSSLLPDSGLPRSARLEDLPRVNPSSLL